MQRYNKIHGHYSRKQYFQLWLKHTLATLPLTKALAFATALMFIFLMVTHVFDLHKTYPKAIVVSQDRRRNFRIIREGDAAANVNKNLRPLITVQLHRRTGNAMFAYASLLGLSKFTSRTPVFSSDHYFHSLFRISAESYSREGIKHWMRLSEKHACMYDDRLENIGELEADMIELLGYFQSWKYFEHIKDKIRAEFTFRDDVRDEATNLIDTAIRRTFGSDARRSDVTLIGIHVRRGDMASYSSYRMGYTIASSEYIAEAMHYFTERFNRTKLLFLLCSDDFDWCSENVKPASAPLVRVENATDSVHLATLASCNHTIMTVGSFGWWAAWLAGGETVYYKDFPRPSSPLFRDFSAEDYFYPGWIGM